MRSIAAVLTAYYPYSHADVIVTKFLKGFPTDDHGLLAPRVKLTDAYLDQIDARDMGQAMLWRHGVKLHQSVREALTGGTNKELAVEGVLLIGEHGNYPYDELGRHMYPRRHLFEQICGVFAETGKVCPVFNDKHLSYNWADAKWMYDRAQQLGVPFLAGSSVPLGWRRPWLEIERGSRVTEAIAIGYAGCEVYGYHTIEALQAMVERRGDGETGVVKVGYLAGDDALNALESGEVPRDLFDAALGSFEEREPGELRDLCSEPMVFSFEYADGLRAWCVMLTGCVKNWGFAGRVDGELAACEMFLQGDFPHGHFNYLSLNIEEMFLTGEPPWPVERTLLTTGMTNAIMDARHLGHAVDTPHLAIAYPPPAHVPWRTRHPRPTGANAEVWPPRGKPVDNPGPPAPDAPVPAAP